MTLSSRFDQSNPPFFYQQNETYHTFAKRAKKIIFNPNSASVKKSLKERLAELLNAKGESLTNVYTDVRLNAIKQLTEDMIAELQDHLAECSASNYRPSLPAPLIVEWHSDWTDLTDKCSYKNFPKWRSKNGRESTLKRTPDTGEHAKKDPNNKRGSNSNSRADDRKSQSPGKNKGNKSKPPKILHGGSISESHQQQQRKAINRPKQSANESLASDLNTSRSSRNNQQYQTTIQLNSSLTRRSSLLAKSPSSIMNIGRSLTMNNNNSRVDIGSRASHNTISSNSIIINYQLSSKVYSDRGWTVQYFNGDDERMENERRILTALAKSLASM